MLDRIDALAEIARDQTRSKEERDGALAALRDIAGTGSTAHERETASHVLKTLDRATDKPLSENTLRILELIGASVEDYWKAASER